MNYAHCNHHRGKCDLLLNLNHHCPTSLNLNRLLKYHFTYKQYSYAQIPRQWYYSSTTNSTVTQPPSSLLTLTYLTQSTVVPFPRICTSAVPFGFPSFSSALQTTNYQTPLEHSHLAETITRTDGTPTCFLRCGQYLHRPRLRILRSTGDFRFLQRSVSGERNEQDFRLAAPTREKREKSRMDVLDLSTAAMVIYEGSCSKLD